MPAILAAILRSSSFLLTWLSRIGLAYFVADYVIKLTPAQQDTVTQATSQAKAAGMSDEEYTKLVAATQYDNIEQQGKEPDDFWAGLSPEEKQLLQFSPETLRQDMGRTKFLGITAALLFASSLAAGGVAGLRGIPVLLSTLAKLAVKRKAGAGALELMTVIEEGKILGISKVWIPGLISGIAAAGGWLTSTMTNNLNDATLWGRIFLGQAADDYEKALQQEKKQASGSSSGGSINNEARTIIRMVEEKKPEQFIGTLFSAKLGAMESFSRHVDDEITDEADLLEDVKLNLNKWLVSLPGRLGYSIVIRQNPVDETGVKQSGIWATLTTHFTRLNGAIQPIDTILLGPVTPVTRLKLSKTLKTVEAQIPGTLTGQEVRVIEVPGGAIDIFDTAGDRVNFGSSNTAASTPAPASAPTPAPTPATPAATPTPPPAASAPAPFDTGVQTTTPQGIAPASSAPAQFPFGTPGTPTPTPPAAAPTPAGPGYDKTKFYQGDRGDFLPALGWYTNQLVKVDTGGANLNVRRAPSTSSEIIHKLPNGTVVPVLNYSGTSNGYKWALILIPGTNRTGDVAADFLKPI